MVPTNAAIAEHYDELDWIYRDVWGEHVHHGLWLAGTERPADAVVLLVHRVARQARLQSGEAVCDVGCGYGATARLLVRDYGVRVTGITLSPVQHARAASLAGDGAATFVLGDWLAGGLPPRAFDAVIAIESVEHMSDKAACFGEARRVLRPGGRFVFSTWLAAGDVRAWERRALLDPLCREGRVAPLATAAEHRRLLREAGFSLESYEDLSLQVKATWSVCIARVLSRLVRDRRYRAYLFSAGSRNRGFARALPRLWLAYETGAMRYGLFACTTMEARRGGSSWTGDSRTACTGS